LSGEEHRARNEKNYQYEDSDFHFGVGDWPCAADRAAQT
jgi:hypothetical protein